MTAIMPERAWLTVVAELLALGALMGGLRLWQQRRAPHPEVVRKCFHVGAGTLTLPLPWLLASTTPVVIMGAVALAALLSLRHMRQLKGGLGSVLGGVARESLGEIYFVLSVFQLFFFSGGQKLLYVIPLLILTWADALAALVGVGYGRLQFSTSEGRKSAEGSLAFFIVAFFSVHVPLLLFSNVGRMESLLIAAITGLLAMMFEGASWGGLDNLFVPMGSLMLLQALLPMTPDELGLRLGVALALAAFGLAWRKRTTLSGSALMSAVVIGFYTWTTGGWAWFLPAFTVFVGHTFFAAKEHRLQMGVQQVHAVLSISAGGLFWLFIHRTQGAPELLYPYTLGYAAHLIIIATIDQMLARPASTPTSLLWQTTLKGWGLLLLPFVLVRGPTLPVVAMAGSALPLLALAAAAFFRWQPALDSGAPAHGRWWRQAICSFAASLLGVPALFLG